MTFSSIEEYNKNIETELGIKNLQLGFFDGKILFIGQNPGMPFNDKTKEDTLKMISKGISYKELIRSSMMGKFISKIVNFDSISFTNIVKVPTVDNTIPTQELVDKYWPITQKQIEIFRPSIVVCLGKFAAGFFGLTEPYSTKKENGILYIAFPHPSYLSRSGTLEENISTMKIILARKKIINAWDFEDIIYLLYRENEKKYIDKIYNFKWYFYIDTVDASKLSGLDIRLINCGELSKVYCSYNLTQTIRSMVKTYEADFSISKRFILDFDFELDENLKILFFDIETDDRLHNIQIGRDRIVSWAAIDTNGKIYYESDKNEKKMLEKLKDIISEYDIIAGWNSSKFDLPYIKERFKVHKIKYTFKKNLHLDLMKRYIKLFAPGMTLMGLKSFSLNDMSMTFLSKQKVDPGDSIYDLFLHDQAKLKKYNIQDVVLLKELNEKMRTIDLMIKEATITKTFMDRFYVGNLLDNYIITEANKRNIKLISKPTDDEIKKRDKIFIRGAFVMDPKVGYYDDVHIFDFKSLYPSIIIGWNIGNDSIIPEVSKIGHINFDEWLNWRKIEDVDYVEWRDFLIEQKNKLDPTDKYIQTANNQFFHKENISFISGLVENLLNERKYFKRELDKYEIGTSEYNNAKAQQEIVKEMANSMFGITADKDSRYFDKRICEGITLTGQYMIKLSSYMFEHNHKLNVLYGDTDSVFVVIDNNPKQIEKDINIEIKKEIEKQFDIRHNIVYLEYEKKFSKFLLMEKKRYCGVMIEMDGKAMQKMYYRGIEVIQKSTIEYTRKKLEEMLKYIMIDGRDIEFIKEWVLTLHYETFNKYFKPEEIVVSQKINKPIDSYKTSLPHTRIARQLIDKKIIFDVVEEKNSWSQIKYIIVDKKKKKEILVDDYLGVFDRVYYWDVKIFAPIKRVLDIIYPEIDWDLAVANQMSLKI